jgi:hypothetical protein
MGPVKNQTPRERKVVVLDDSDDEPMDKRSSAGRLTVPSISRFALLSSFFVFFLLSLSP